MSNYHTTSPLCSSMLEKVTCSKAKSRSIFRRMMNCEGCNPARSKLPTPAFCAANPRCFPPPGPFSPAWPAEVLRLPRLMARLRFMAEAAKAATSWVEDCRWRTRGVASWVSWDRPWCRIQG